MKNKFERIECVYAFYDDYSDQVFYQFETRPEIGHGEWAISRGGDVAYDMRFDRVCQDDFPSELIILTSHIPIDIFIDGIEE